MIIMHFESFKVTNEIDQIPFIFYRSEKSCLPGDAQHPANTHALKTEYLQLKY